MKKFKYTAILTFVISLMMVVSIMFPNLTRAEEKTTSSTAETTRETAQGHTNQKTDDQRTDTYDQLIERSSSSFSSEKTVDGVKVKVTADANVFPEGTTMEVKKVSLSATEKKLVSAKQESKQSTIKQYSFDITMKNKDGEEIEPDTSKGKVKVSFENELVKAFTTNVYHIDDHEKIETLKLTKSKNTVTGETTGFSTYYIGFTVNNVQTLKVAVGSTINLTKELTSMLNLPDGTKITSITENNKTDFEGHKYGKLEQHSDGSYSLSLYKKLRANGTTFTIRIEGSDDPITLTLKNATLQYSGDAEWLNDYATVKNDRNKTIALKKYNGSATNLTIPAKVTVDHESYQIVMSGGVYQKTKIESIKFESGVIADESLENLFDTCLSLKQVDISNLDTSKTTNMAFMFYGCSVLTNDGTDSYIKFKNSDGKETKFTTKNVTSMSEMFYMSGITKVDLSQFDFSSIEEMNAMFAVCDGLTEVDLSSLSGAKTKLTYTEYNGLFSLCSHLNKIILGANWQAAEQNKYLPLSLSDNWENTKTLEIYTNEDLSENFTSSMAGTYIKTTLPPSSGTTPKYVVDGYQKKENMWEVHTPNETFHGYCLDHSKATPSGYFDKVEIDIDATESTKKVDSNGRSNYIMDYLDTTNYGYKELAPNMAKALVALIYWSEYGNHGGTYDQDDIWHFTNDYSSTMSPSLKAKIAGHTYDDIGTKFKLYIYVPSENNKANKKNAMQNLLSIEGATTKTYAGVQVQKVDNTENANPVGGATFRVYKTDDQGNKSGEKFGNGETYLEFTTSSNGIGGLYRMDNSQGLPVGQYILEEYNAPAGYEKNTTSYKFSVTDDDNQKVMTVGDSNGVIVDDVVTHYSGGGITLKKVDRTTHSGLANATFTLYKVDSSNKETAVKTYTTNSNGVLTTGSQDLEIGTKYTIKETKAPEGYKNEGYQTDIILDNNYKNKFYDLGTVDNTPKTGTVTIKAKKVLKNSGTLKAGAYSFQLLDEKGTVLQTKTNANDGTITFDAITLSASDIPAVDYQIKEVKGSDQNIEYDEHTEKVRVVITEDDQGNLVCTPKYDRDGATFTNTAKVNFTGQLTVKKKVEGILGDKNEAFNFNLYLTSDSTDLNARTFNYTLDGKSGTFTFNKVETTSDGKTKFVTRQTFKLKDGSSLKLTDLPVGTSYEVKEDDYTSDGYTTTKMGDTGTISADGTTVSFTNTKNVIVPTSADTLTRFPFWIAGALGALVIIYFKKRQKRKEK